jgi:hypothetical protein
MAEKDISFKSIDGAGASGGEFMRAAVRMDQRRLDLRRTVNAMDWDTESRLQYNALLDRFDRAYDDLRAILHKLGGNVVQVADRTKRTEDNLTKLWT